jgi:hypothetical protein
LDISLLSVCLLDVLILDAAARIASLTGLHRGRHGARILEERNLAILIYNAIPLKDNSAVVLPPFITFGQLRPLSNTNAKESAHVYFPLFSARFGGNIVRFTDRGDVPNVFGMKAAPFFLYGLKRKGLAI